MLRSVVGLLHRSWAEVSSALPRMWDSLEGRRAVALGAFAEGRWFDSKRRGRGDWSDPIQGSLLPSR